MARRPVILEHNIVGQSQLTHLTIRRDRRWAGCKICGAAFQPDVLRKYSLLTPAIEAQAEIEIADWRVRHNKTHTSTEHRQFNQSGLALSPEASHRLAPFGIVSVGDALFEEEVKQSLQEAPRAPVDDAEGSTKKGFK